MTVSADDAAATLALVIPGFVALSLFYWFGVQVKRADWRWLVWSLLVTVPIAWAAGAIAELLGASSADLEASFAECGVEAAQGAQDLAGFEAQLGQCASTALAQHNPELRLGIALLLAVVGAAIAVYIWRWAAKRWPQLRSRTQPLAWGVALRPERWLEVKTSDGEVYSGYNREVADPVETEDLDLYLGSPARIVGTEAQLLEGVEGLLIRRQDIRWIRVMEPAQSSDSPTP